MARHAPARSGSSSRSELPAFTAAMAKLRLRHLQLLDALDRLGSLRQAALELGIQQPAALALVDDLEFAFGISLVARDHSGTVLTPAATVLLARSRVALQEIAYARHLTMRSDAAGGRLRIGASPYLIGAMLPEMMAMLCVVRPALEIDVREGTLDMLLAELADGRLDAVLGSVERAAVLASAVSLESTVLAGEEMSVLAGRGHPLFGQRHATLDSVLAGPWVLPHTSSHVRGLVDSAVFACGGEALQPRVQCRGIQNLLSMASTAGWLTVGPSREARKRSWRGRVSVLHTPLQLQAPPYVLVQRRYADPGKDLLALRSCASSVARRLFGTLGA